MAATEPYLLLHAATGPRRVQLGALGEYSVHIALLLQVLVAPVFPQLDDVVLAFATSLLQINTLRIVMEGLARVRGTEGRS